MSTGPKEVELTTIGVVRKEETSDELYKWESDDLGAPTASKKDTLFDWQMENDGVKSIDRFGGLAALLKTFGTDPNNPFVGIDVGAGKRPAPY
ncbi:hypothetical protein WA538_003561 [Blastocystis sp. DL]